jgi:hypothetical protein
MRDTGRTGLAVRATYEPHARPCSLLAAYRHHREAEEAAGHAAIGVFVYGLALAVTFTAPALVIVAVVAAAAPVAYSAYVIAPARAAAWEELHRE